jgi:hypothetical protein
MPELLLCAHITLCDSTEIPSQYVIANKLTY